MRKCEKKTKKKEKKKKKRKNTVILKEYVPVQYRIWIDHVRFTFWISQHAFDTLQYQLY